MQRQTSESATIAGTADFLNGYVYDANSQLTEITQQGQTGGNSVTETRVDYGFDHDGRILTM